MPDFEAVTRTWAALRLGVEVDAIQRVDFETESGDTEPSTWVHFEIFYRNTEGKYRYEYVSLDDANHFARIVNELIEVAAGNPPTGLRTPPRCE